MEEKARTVGEMALFNQVKTLCANTRIPDKALWALIERWGAKAYEAVTRDPFILTDYDQVGFGSADTIRERLKLPFDFPPRLASGVQSVLATAASGQGHVCLPRWLLTNDSVTLLGRAQIRNAMIDAIIQKLHQYDRVAFSGEMVYLKNFHREEQYLSAKIRELQQCNLVVPIDPDLSDLAVDQIQAVRMIQEHPVSILTGFPGSGKTFAIKRIIDSIPGDIVALAAPTGKAAKRMMELTGRDASTIHRLLEAFLDDGRFVFARDADLPIDKKIIVLDEASMIDQSLAYHFLQAVEEGTRLILVGDVDQLPPVGPGNVLRDLIASGTVPCASLTTIKRQDPGLIIRSCHAIREGKTPPIDLPNTGNVMECPLEGDMWFLKITEQSGILDVINHLVISTLPSMGYDPLRQVQVLSPFRSKTDLSCQGINEMLQAYFTKPTDNRLKYRIGDKVIQTRNDYALGIINGDIGFICDITYESMGLFEGYGKATYHVEFENPSRFVSIPAKDHDLQLAYCVTCVSGDTMISTSDGIKKMSELKISYLPKGVQSGFNFKPAKQFISQGNRKTLKITTKRGYSISVTPEHRFLYMRKFKYEWIEAYKLRRGSSICISRGTGLVCQQDYVGPIQAKFLGALVADGSYIDCLDYRVEFSKSGPWFDEVLSILKCWYTGNISITKTKSPETKRWYIHSKSFRDMMFKLGMGYLKSHEKTVPSSILSSGEHVVCAFINGLFSGDGSVNKQSRTIRYVTASPILAQQVHFLLLCIGIVATKKTVNPRHHVITISGTDNLERFKNLIHFSHPLKKSKLEEILLKKSRKLNDGFIPDGHLLCAEIRNQLKERDGRNYNASKRVMYLLSAITKARLNLTYEHLNEIKSGINDFFSLQVSSAVNKLMTDNFFFDQVISVEEGREEPVYDLTMDKPHAYMTNGFISHNCHKYQGSEVEVVIIPIHEAFGDWFVQRNWLYTAVSRAKKLCILVGQSKEIPKIVKLNKQKRRYTRLAEILRNGD